MLSALCVCYLPVNVYCGPISHTHKKRIARPRVHVWRPHICCGAFGAPLPAYYSSRKRGQRSNSLTVFRYGSKHSPPTPYPPPLSVTCGVGVCNQWPFAFVELFFCGPTPPPVPLFVRRACTVFCRRSEVNDLLVGFGQQVCRATAPLCSTCGISGICPSAERNGDLSLPPNTG